MNTEYRILERDVYLRSFVSDIQLRMDQYQKTREAIVGRRGTLRKYADWHHYLGFHQDKASWVYREWVPGAMAVSLFGDFNGWDRTSHKLTKKENDIWEIRVKGKIPHGSKVRIQIYTGEELLERIPAYIKRAVQNEETYSYDGVIWCPQEAFVWTDENYQRKAGWSPLIYEAHVGMSGEKEGITSYREFTKQILPRIKKLGYNTVQLMAIMEHPYYGSFGYQVSNFFAVSSRCGTPEDLKELVNTAHKMGIAVIMDVIHSHAAPNETEGLARFDGTTHQFFHEGQRGWHPAWGTKLFNYGKHEVLKFLLSNLRYWLEEYHFDGFRFDGVTSMLYHNHGLGEAFDNYKKYFSLNTDIEAITYLQLAAELCKEVKPDSILIAEDMSGMPGMCLPVSEGGIGFDYRLGMGVPDFWIHLLRDMRDEDWSTGQLWHELNQRRAGEKVIGYSESHDQAIVGDKTIMFRLADKEMYWSMDTESDSIIIERAMRLHKMIRLLTCMCAGEGYLNFMGNEFGHPEWIDFPREENGFSYQHARRQWSLAADEHLRYRYLEAFDKAMIRIADNGRLLPEISRLVYIHEAAKIIVFRKGTYLFAFNFHPTEDYTGIIPPELDDMKGSRIVLHTDWEQFGGWMKKGKNRIVFPRKEETFTLRSRVAIVFKTDQ